MKTATVDWKTTAKRNIAKMSGLEALEAQKKIAFRGTAFPDVVREITGGYASQAISFWVIQQLQVQIRKAQKAK